jgi:DNA primase
VSSSDLAALVKQAVDITEVIGQVVPLRRVGNRYVGLCPFHQEKTPSFHVDSENQFYHCFGCGTGGDVLSFIMKQRNFTFGEAIKQLAERYHIALPQSGVASPEAGAIHASKRQKQQIYDLLNAAADYFYKQLHHSQAGKIARDYLRRRGLPASVIESERLGYALDQWDGLLQHFNKMGAAQNVALEAGLLVRSSKDRLYDRFRDRLMFPIRNDHGQVVAFGGRSLVGEKANGNSSAPSSHEPKYLNSPESPVYHKGRMLYQQARAREECRHTRQVILVEGYMDLLAFHAHGFYRVVATLGTALTLHQVRLMRRMCDEVVLAYDADDAGEKAMMKALPLFLQEGLAVSCLCFPAGMDPDDFLKQQGIDAVEKLLRERLDLGVYVVRKRLESWDGSVSGKSKVLSQLMPLLEDVRQPVAKAEYLRLISERLKLSEAALLKQLRMSKSQTHSFYASCPRINSPSHLNQTQSLEESILRAVIKYPALIEKVRDSGAVSNFQSAQLKSIAECLLHVASLPHEGFNVAAVYDSLQDDDLKGLFTHFMLETTELAGVQVLMDDWLRALCERSRRKVRIDLHTALHQAEREGDRTQVRKLLSELQNLCSANRAADPSDNV